MNGSSVIPYTILAETTYNKPQVDPNSQLATSKLSVIWYTDLEVKVKGKVIYFIKGLIWLIFMNKFDAWHEQMFDPYLLCVLMMWRVLLLIKPETWVLVA